MKGGRNVRRAEKQVTDNSQYLSRNQSNNKKEKRKKTVKRQWLCVMIVFLSVVMAILNWILIKFAEELFEWFLGAYVVCGGAIVSYFLKEKQFLLAGILIVTLGVVSFNSAIAKGVCNNRNQERHEVDESKGNETIDSDQEAPQNSLEDEIVVQTKEFSWHEDIYIFQLDDYSRIEGDLHNQLYFLVDTYVHMYTNGEKILVEKSYGELVGGDYGVYLKLANAYAKDYAAVKTTKAKMIILNYEIEEREAALLICAKADNLKILGDCYVKKIILSNLTGNAKEDEVMRAIEYYVKALPLAYYDVKTSIGESEKITKTTELIELWNALTDAFVNLSDVVDDSHSKRCKDLSVVCKEFSSSLVSEIEDR